MFSRVIGAILRTFLIIIGFIFEVIIFVLGGVLFFCWLLLPVFLFVSFIFGIKLLF